MPIDRLSRTRLLIGDAGIARLQSARVAVFGLGGVGAACAEALARSGVGHLTLVDHDTVSETNLNRQLIALRSTLGMRKTEVMASRIADIDPGVETLTFPVFFLPDAETFDIAFLRKYDYIVDCIDTVSAKLELIARAKRADVPVISCMGAGNRMLPERLRVGYIEETKNDPLARTMRRELKARGIGGVRVVWSDELPLKADASLSDEVTAKRSIPGSMSFVPPVAGYLAAGEVIRTLTEDARPRHTEEKQTNG